MSEGIRTIIYPVKDLDRAKELYGTILGVEPYADAAYYAGFRIGDQEIGLDPNGHSQGMTGPLGYFHVTDIRTTLRSLQSLGAEIQGDVRDVGGGRLIASVKDADGNLIGLLQSE